MSIEMYVNVFALAFAVSALGSLPPGAINLTAAHLAATQGKNSALRFVAIAAIAECPHILLALLLNRWLGHSEAMSLYFRYAAVVFLLVLGTRHLLKAQKTAPVASFYSPLKAWGLNLLNPFSVPFWFFFTTFLSTEGWLPAGFSVFTFCLGASAGAAATLVGYVYLSAFWAGKLQPNTLNLDRWVGVALLCMGCIKAFALV